MSFIRPYLIGLFCIAPLIWGCSDSDSGTVPDQQIQDKDSTITHDLSVTDGVANTDVTLNKDSALDAVANSDVTLNKDLAQEGLVPSDFSIFIADGASGACINAADKAIISNRVSTIEKTMGTCIFQCLTGGEPCIKNCMVKATGLSEACATCFAKTGACSLSKCLICAAGQDKPECQDCLAKNCLPAFEACSGLKMP